MKKFFLISAMVAIYSCTMSSMQQLPPSGQQVPIFPSLFLDVINKTQTHYFLSSQAGQTKLLKAGHSARLDLSNEWNAHKDVTIFIKDAEGNIKLSGVFSMIRRHEMRAMIDNEFIPGDFGFFKKLFGLYGNKALSLLFIDINNPKNSSVIINLTLKGNNLEESFMEDTLIEKYD